MIPSPVFTSFNLIVDGRVRRYELAKGVYALLPLGTPNDPMRIESFDAIAMLMTATGVIGMCEAMRDRRMVASDAVPAPLFGWPIGMVGCLIAFDDNGELML